MKKSCKLLSAALLALASFVSVQATEITLYEGTSSNEGTPVYAYNFDSENYITQTIFPEADLTAMVGQPIKAMKFYVNGEVEANSVVLAVSVGMTTQSSFSGWSPSAISGLTHVADITMNAGDTELLITFDEPFVYEGGNLVLETKVVTAGSWTDMYFFGVAAEVTNVLHMRYASNVDAFLPMTTFTYGDGETPEPQYIRGDVDGDGNVGIADVTALIDYILTGAAEGIDMKAADCDEDTNIGIADVTALIEYILTGNW